MKKQMPIVMLNKHPVLLLRGQLLPRIVGLDPGLESPQGRPRLGQARVRLRHLFLQNDVKLPLFFDQQMERRSGMRYQAARAAQRSVAIRCISRL